MPSRLAQGELSSAFDPIRGDVFSLFVGVLFEISHQQKRVPLPYFVVATAIWDMGMNRSWAPFGEYHLGGDGCAPPAVEGGPTFVAMCVCVGVRVCEFFDTTLFKVG